jgi:hypothetical protein
MTLPKISIGPTMAEAFSSVKKMKLSAAYRRRHDETAYRHADRKRSSLFIRDFPLERVLR